MLLNDGYTKGWTGLTALYPAFIPLYGAGRLCMLHGQNLYATVCRTGEKKSTRIVSGNGGQCCILNGHVGVCCSLGVDVAGGQCAFVSRGLTFTTRDPNALTLDAEGNINTS